MFGESKSLCLPMAVSCALNRGHEGLEEQAKGFSRGRGVVRTVVRLVK